MGIASTKKSLRFGKTNLISFPLLFVGVTLLFYGVFSKDYILAFIGLVITVIGAKIESRAMEEFVHTED